jgi:hypothetical protein
MNVLINSDEWVTPWIREFAMEQVKQNPPRMLWNQTEEYLSQCRCQYSATGLITVDFNRVNYLLTQDLEFYRDVINTHYKTTFKLLKPNAIQLIRSMDITDQEIVDRYIVDPEPAFAKSLANQLTDRPRWILNKSKINWKQSFLIRNIINNEDVIKRCLDDNKDFWFVDSGYTNFLYQKQKIWHRLLHNQIHHSGLEQKFPEDRIDLLPSLPRKWRRKGGKILVVESSDSHYAMKGISADIWREQVRTALNGVTDRPVDFRSKEISRKTRRTVYDLLSQTNEYYCVISDSSAAAVEAIWTGTPVITLGRHITNPVSRDSISELNNLYRGDIDSWLAMLSYSQFTFEELCNGTALSIVQEFHDV